MNYPMHVPTAAIAGSQPPPTTPPNPHSLSNFFILSPIRWHKHQISRSKRCRPATTAFLPASPHVFGPRQHGSKRQRFWASAAWARKGHEGAAMLRTCTAHGLCSERGKVRAGTTWQEGRSQWQLAWRVGALEVGAKGGGGETNFPRQGSYR